jgi:hypothetical protein
MGKPLPHAIRYHFSQRFAVSVQAAYQWCTNFAPEDHALMGNDNAKREVTRLTDSTIILKESFCTNNGDIEKQKLVQLYPDQLFWGSTHLAGSNKYSQFMYKLSAEIDGTSRLDFTALHIEHQDNLTTNDIKSLTDELRKSDSNVWKLLAKSMEKELNK